MATLNNFYEAVTEASTTTTGPNTAAVTSGAVSLAAGAYLVLWNCDISTTLASVAGNVTALSQDATPTTLAQNVVLEGFKQATSPADYFSIGGAYTFTLGGTTSVTHAINYGPESAGTCKIKNARIVVLLLGASDQVATLSGYVAGSDQVTTTNATATDTGLTLGFTPATSGDYLVMAFAELNNSATTAATRTLINDGSSSIETGHAPRRTTDYRSVAQVWKRTYAASAQSIKIQHRTTTATTTTTATRRLLLVALRLDAFANASHVALGVDSSTSSTTYSIATSLTDYRRQRNHLSIFCWPETSNTTSFSLYGKATDNGTDVSEHIRESAESTNSRWSNFDILVSNVSDGFNQYTASISKTTEIGGNVTVLSGSGGATITVLDVGAVETLALKSTQSYIEAAYNLVGTLKLTQTYLEAAFNKMGTLKATQNYIEAAFNKMGTLKASQTYIEVVRGNVTWAKALGASSANRTELIMAAAVGATHKYTKPIHILSANSVRTARAITKKIASLTTNVANIVRSTVRIVKATGQGQTVATNRRKFKFKSAISSALPQTIGRRRSALKLIQPTLPQVVVVTTPQPVQNLTQTVTIAQAQVTAAVRSIIKIVRTTTPEVMVVQLMRMVNKLVAVPQTQSARVPRNTSKVLAAAQGAIVSVTLSTSKAVAAAQSLVGTSTVMLAKRLNLSLAQITTGLRSVGKSVLVIRTQANNLVRGLAKMLGTAQTQVVSMLRSLAKQISLTDPQTVARQSQLGKAVAFVQTTHIELSRNVGKAVAVGLNQIGSISRGVVSMLRATQAQGANLLRVTGKQIGYTGAQSLSRYGQVGKAVSAVQAVTATTARGVLKLISAANVVIANLIVTPLGAIQVINKAISVTQAQIVRVSRTIPKLVARSLVLSARLVKRYNMRIALAWPQSLKLVRRVNKRIAGVLAEAISIGRARLFSRNVHMDQTATLRRGVGKQIIVFSGWQGMLTLSIAKLITTTQAIAILMQKASVRTISLASGQFVSLSNTIAMVVAWTQGHFSAAVLVTGKLISTSLVGTINYVNTIGKTIATMWSYGLAMFSQRTFQIAVAQSQAPELIRHIGKLVGTFATQAPALLRRVGKRIGLTQTSTVVADVIRTVLMAVTLGQIVRLRRTAQHRIHVVVVGITRLRRTMAKRVSVHGGNSLRTMRAVGKRVRIRLTPITSAASFFISGASIYGLSIGAMQDNTTNMVWFKSYGWTVSITQPIPLDVTKYISKTIRLSNGLVGALAAAIRLRRKLQMMLAFFR